MTGKKMYEEPEMILTVFILEDVLTVSNGGENGSLSESEWGTF